MIRLKSSINTNKILLHYSSICALVSLACCSGFVQPNSGWAVFNSHTTAFTVLKRKEVGSQLCPTVSRIDHMALAVLGMLHIDLGARGDDPDLPSHGSW